MLDEFLIPSGPELVETLLSAIPEGRGFSQCLIEAADPLDGLSLAMNCVLWGMTSTSGPVSGASLVILTRSPDRRAACAGGAGEWVWRGAGPATTGRPDVMRRPPEGARPGGAGVETSRQGEGEDPRVTSRSPSPSRSQHSAGQSVGQSMGNSAGHSAGHSAGQDQIVSQQSDLLLSSLDISRRGDRLATQRGPGGLGDSGAPGAPPGLAPAIPAGAPRVALEEPGQVKLPLNWFWDSPGLGQYRSQISVHYAPTYQALSDLLSCRWPEAVGTVVLCDLADCSRDYAAPHSSRLEAALLAVLRARCARSIVVSSARGPAPSCDAHLRVGPAQQPYGLRSLWARYVCQATETEGPELLMRPDASGFAVCVGVRRPGGAGGAEGEGGGSADGGGSGEGEGG